MSWLGAENQFCRHDIGSNRTGSGAGQRTARRQNREGFLVSRGSINNISVGHHAGNRRQSRGSGKSAGPSGNREQDISDIISVFQAASVSGLKHRLAGQSNARNRTGRLDSINKDCCQNIRINISAGNRSATEVLISQSVIRKGESGGGVIRSGSVNKISESHDAA